MRAGDVIADRYRIETLLIRRGLNQVFEATDVVHEAPVALKVSTPSTGYYELQDQIQRAVRVGRELDKASAGVVRPLDGGEEGASLWLTMDYIPGAEDIDLTQGPVDERLRRFRRVALLVRELHALRVVHRDIRPGNFLIGTSGRIHVSNFGISRSLDDRLDEGDVVRGIMVLGFNHSYLAPEFLTGTALDPAMDVYSLGVMLFELLTEQLPYRGTADDVIATHNEVLEGYADGPLPSDLRASIPQEFDDVVRYAMHVDPVQRFANVDELLRAVDDASPGLAERAPARTGRFPGPGYAGPGHVGPLPREFGRRDAPPPVQPRPSEIMRRLEVEQEPPPPEPEPEVDPQTRTLINLRRKLPLVGGAVSLASESKEVKFVYFSAHEEISGTVSLSYAVHDERGRYGRVEQRVTLDLENTQGAPSGPVNLLHAVNAVNLYGAGLSAQFTEARLRLRRSVLLGQAAPLEADDLQGQVDLLLELWPFVFAALRDVQAGVAWNEAVGFLVRKRQPDAERLESLRTMLAREGYSVDEGEDGQILIGNEDDRVEIHCGQNQSLGSILVRPWQAPKSAARALKKGKPAPEIEHLLLELNEKNLESFYTLAWDPKRGVTAQAPLAEPAFTPDRLDQFLALLREARDEVFEALGEGDAPAPGRKSWVPWRK